MIESNSAAPSAFHSHVFLGEGHEKSERKTWAVIWLYGAMMIAEIVGGLLFGSIALVADGLHMSTHAGALLLAALAYTYARKHQIATLPTGDRLISGSLKRVRQHYRVQYSSRLSPRERTRNGGTALSRPRARFNICQAACVPADANIPRRSRTRSLFGGD
jgi:Cation efflux family